MGLRRGTLRRTQHQFAVLSAACFVAHMGCATGLISREHSAKCRVDEAESCEFDAEGFETYLTLLRVHRGAPMGTAALSPVKTVLDCWHNAWHDKMSLNYPDASLDLRLCDARPKGGWGLYRSDETRRKLDDDHGENGGYRGGAVGGEQHGAGQTTRTSSHQGPLLRLDSQLWLYVALAVLSQYSRSSFSFLGMVWEFVAFILPSAVPTGTGQSARKEDDVRSIRAPSVWEDTSVRRRRRRRRRRTGKTCQHNLGVDGFPCI